MLNYISQDFLMTCIFINSVWSFRLLSTLFHLWLNYSSIKQVNKTHLESFKFDVLEYYYELLIAYKTHACIYFYIIITHFK